MLPKPECKCGCGNLVAPGRKVYATPQCHGRWRHKVHNHREVRTALFERDGGVCSMCGCNTMQMRSEHIERLHARFPGQIPVLMDELHPEIRPSGFPSLRHSWWQADHEIPVIEGGTSDSNNYRSLCTPCHKEETRSLQCRRAENRRAGDTLSLGLGIG
jgi:5-methylcytosine-specific restriction endonuclease McrA